MNEALQLVLQVFAGWVSRQQLDVIGYLCEENRVLREQLRENHLRSAFTVFTLHYHGERHHQGLGHRLLEPDETAERSAGQVACRERVGGMLRYDYRKAA